MLDSNGSFDNPFFQDKKIVKIDCKWKDQEYTKDAFGFTHAEYVCSFILKENPEAEIILVPIVRKNKKSTVLDMIEGIELLIEEQVDIINMSIGDEYKYHKEIEEVCRAATEKGILIVAAYSNQQVEATYPASFPFVMGVRCLDIENPLQVLQYDGTGTDVIFSSKFFSLYHVGIGELVTYNILIGYLLTPVKDIVNLQPLYHSAHVAMERLESVLRIKVEKTKEGIEPFEFDEEIELKDVDFHFVSGKNILNNINIKIRKGDNVAIIGETGSGKTSLAKLFMEFYSPDKGHIYVDGAELQNFEVQEIRKAVVYVSQEDFLFTASVRENLKMGNEEISDEEMIEISRKMGVHQFVSKMERAYDSVLEERGKNLSKGQRQKLSLTRAILRHPKILILDEATSNMDSISERETLNYIKGIRDITLILISHRINVIADSDCIYVLQKGNIVARGTDKQLKEQCKLYRQLYGEEEK